MNDPTRLPSRPRTAYPRALVSRSRSCLGSLLRCAAPTTEILPVTRREQRPDREEDRGTGNAVARTPGVDLLTFRPLRGALLLNPGRAISTAVPTPNGYGNRRAGLHPPKRSGNVRRTAEAREPSGRDDLGEPGPGLRAWRQAEPVTQGEIPHPAPHLLGMATGANKWPISRPLRARRRLISAFQGFSSSGPRWFPIVEHAIDEHVAHRARYRSTGRIRPGSRVSLKNAPGRVGGSTPLNKPPRPARAPACPRSR
jgi:hypothetical protein